MYLDSSFFLLSILPLFLGLIALPKALELAKTAASSFDICSYVGLLFVCLCLVINYFCLEAGKTRLSFYLAISTITSSLAISLCFTYWPGLVLVIVVCGALQVLVASTIKGGI